MAKKAKKAAGKKPAKAAAPAAPEATERTAAATRLGNAINEADLRSLLKRTTSLKKQSDEIIGDLREQIAQAVEKKHLHKGAFAQLRRFRSMSTEKLVEHWDHLEHYMELSGEFDRMEEQERLPLEPEEPEAEMLDAVAADTVPKQPATNVSRPRFGARGEVGPAVPETDAKLA